MKQKEIVCTYKPKKRLDEKDNTEFFINFQKAILLSLEKRNLLSMPQTQRCLEEVEKQYSRKKYSQA